MTSVTLMPEQIVTIRRLQADTEAFAVDIEPAAHMSLDVMTFTRLGGDDEDDSALQVRHFNVSVAGTARERDAEAAVAA